MTDVPAELEHLRARATAAGARLDTESGLRAVVDMDQAAITTRLDAQHSLLRALARTQSDHTAQLREQGERLDQVQAGTGRVQVGVDNILGLLGGTNDPAGNGEAPGPSGARPPRAPARTAPRTAGQAWAALRATRPRSLSGGLIAW